MRGFPPRRRHRRAIVVTIALVLAAHTIAGPHALAQTPQGQQPLPSWARPKQPPQAPPPSASPVIARVGGRDITRADFDRVAQPYYRTLRAQLGSGFTGELEKMAGYNVMDELIRREILALESQRQKIVVTQDDIDALLMQDPFFLTNGKFDAAKLSSYKTSPSSNYLAVLPRVRESAAIGKLEQSLRRRFTPTSAQVKAEWARRNDQVRFRMLPLLARDVSGEPEASEAEWAEYYQAHPDQFMRKTRVRLRYARLGLPAEGDTTRAAEESRALERARAIADSLRQGTLPDSSTRLTDSGLFDIPGPSIPGLGRVAGLTDTLARLDADTSIRVVGPYAARDAIIVGVVAERQPRYLPPMREVLGDVKRRADTEKRRVTDEADRRAFYQANRERWRGTRATLTRVTLNPTTITVPAPPPAEVERWFALHGRSLFGLPDTSQAWMPPINDSLRAVVAAKWMDEQRPRRAAEQMGRIVAGLRSARDARTVAAPNGAVAETLSLVKGVGADSLFQGPFLDSLLASAAAIRGAIQGPRTFGAYAVAWRIEAVDTAYVPPYESVRARSDQEFTEERNRKDEAEARGYFDEHRAEFQTPVKYGLDYVLVRIPPADSVRVPEAEIRRHYDAHRQDFRQEEQVSARHILFMTRDAGPEVEKRAQARAESLLAAIRKDGGDFADLARRFSEEPGAATRGGDLGWFGRGRMAKEFETAAFALKPGEVSPVVKTQFGYHLIKLEDRKPAGVRPYDEVRAGIRAQMARTRGDSTGQRAAMTLRRRLALGGDAKTLAAPHGGVVAATPVAAGEALPGIGVPQGLAAALPGTPVGKWAPGVYRAGNSFLVVRVREQLPQRPAEFDEVKFQAIESMKSARRRAALDRRVESFRSALASGAALDSLAAPYGGLKDSGFLGQMAGFVPMLGSEPRVIQRAFAMKPGELSDTLQVAQGVVWLRVEEKKSGDAATMKAATDQIESELAKKKYDEWLEERKRSAGIEILRPELRRPPPSPFGAASLMPGR